MKYWSKLLTKHTPRKQTVCMVLNISIDTVTKLNNNLYIIHKNIKTDEHL